MQGFTVLRRGIYTSAIPPPGWPPAQRPPPEPARPSISAGAAQWICGYRNATGTVCTCTFTTYKGVRQHRMAKHGMRDIWTRAVTTNTRPYCLVTFSCVKTTQRHLLATVSRGGRCNDQSRFFRWANASRSSGLPPL
eukprot:3177991-Pyramimonas_sp.AAC.2